MLKSLTNIFNRDYQKNTISDDFNESLDAINQLLMKVKEEGSSKLLLTLTNDHFEVHCVRGKMRYPIDVSFSVDRCKIIMRVLFHHRENGSGEQSYHPASIQRFDVVPCGRLILSSGVSRLEISRSSVAPEGDLMVIDMLYQDDQHLVA